MNWKTVFFFLALSFPLAPSVLCLGKEGLVADGFVSLFDGETLAGWKPLPGGKWEVVDAAIVGSQEKTEKLHGLLLSEKEYGDFVVRLKFKALEGNSGFYFRAQQIDHIYSVKGFQAEIDSRGKSIGGLYETLGRAWVLRPEQEIVDTCYHAKQWNTMTVTAIHGDITVEVNGTQTAQIKDDPSPRRGFLGLQLHGGQEMHMMFKDIEIKQLGKQLGTDVAPKQDSTTNQVREET